MSIARAPCRAVYGVGGVGFIVIRAYDQLWEVCTLHISFYQLSSVRVPMAFRLHTRT